MSGKKKDAEQKASGAPLIPKKMKRMLLRSDHHVEESAINLVVPLAIESVDIFPVV
jgi:hypothetical protein